MYESFYGFDQRPFLTVPTLDRYFPAASMEAAYQTVLRAIQRCEGPVAIFGGAGLGKTMCCLRIAASIPRNFDVVTLASAQVITRRALLQNLLYEMHLPCHDGSEGDLRLRLLERLQLSHENPSDGLVLIVDEAQTLSIKLLEELRNLTNVVHAGIPRLRLVLCGSLRLEETLTHPQMESLNQRLAARCYLTPLNHQESDRYVQHKIELCGQRWEDVITRDGLEAIYRAADGIPRLIDQVADQSLLLGAKESIRPINAVVVGYAWSTLQQLPNPWSDALPGTPAVAGPEGSDMEEFQDGEENAIEFGSLQDPVVGEFRDSPSHAVDEVAFAAEDEIPGTLFASFFETDGEELPIPIQSLRGYQNLSGIASGDLQSHDNLAWEGMQSIPGNGSYAEAADFIEPTPPQVTSSYPDASSEPIRSPSSEPTVEYQLQAMEPDMRSGYVDDDMDALERQIEDDMRRLVSDLNVSAVREHFDSLPPSYDILREHIEIPSEDSLPASLDNLRLQPLDPAHSSPVPAPAMMDDRDLIVIEEDVQEIKRIQEEAVESKPPAPIHPYAKLFSQVRTP